MIHHYTRLNCVLLCLRHSLLKDTLHASNYLELNLVIHRKCRNGTKGLRVGVSELLEELGVLILLQCL